MSESLNFCILHTKTPNEVTVLWQDSEDVVTVP